MTESLGNFTVAAVREHEDAIRLVAMATGLSGRQIRGYLADAHGKTLVRNVFKDHWPVRASMLANVTAKQAHDCALFDEIATVTGLSERSVRKRIQESHGGRTLRRIFEREWPQEDEAENGGFIYRAPDTAAGEAKASPTSEHQLAAESVVGALRLSTEWSRPRRIDRVLILIGMEVPQRLRTARFQELVNFLWRRGVEMQLADGSEPFSCNSASPGIHARVRLRKSAAAARLRYAVQLPSKSSSPCAALSHATDAQSAPDATQEAADIAASVVQIGLVVSQSDHFTHPLEVEKIRARAQRDSVSLAPTARVRLLSIVDADGSKIDVEEVTRKITARLDLSDRCDVFEHLFEIATADGIIVPEEAEALRWFERALQPRPGLLEELLRRHDATRAKRAVTKEDAGDNAHLRPARLSSDAPGDNSRRQHLDITSSVDEIMNLLFSR